jgi:phosphoribosyl-ATP pyrophosphohydrolase/phosphoribosyl-AMP cyclohydrolase
MLGYMNPESLRRTLDTRRVAFFSRSRNELWTKGETSGHYLDVVDVSADCDSDTILVLAHPAGPTCHKGTETCFAEAATPAASRIAFLASLEATIARRIAESPEGSYTSRLYASGIGRIAQKVGEEGVETALAAVTRDDGEMLGECADLLYHLLVLLKARNLSLELVVQELVSRHASKA